MKRLTWILLLLVLPCFSQGTSASADGHFWDALSSIFIAIFTAVIALVSFLQWKALLASVNATKQAFLTTHRPRIAVKFMRLSGVGTMELSGSFAVFNSGETRAILKRHYSDIIVATVLPAMAPSQKDGDEFTDVELRPGESQNVSLPTGRIKTLSVNERNAIVNRIEDIQRHGSDTESNPPNLFVVGWIKFIDEGAVLRTVGFCKKYNFGTHRFERESDDDYEYGDDGYTRT